MKIAEGNAHRIRGRVPGLEMCTGYVVECQARNFLCYFPITVTKYQHQEAKHKA